MKILKAVDLEEGKVYIAVHALTLSNDPFNAALLVTKKLKNKIRYKWLDGYYNDEKLYINFYEDKDFVLDETLNSPLAKAMREIEE